MFGRGAIDFIKKTCGAHYRMMTASWEVNKKSIWNYITASTGWGKSSHHALLPILNWQKRGRRLLQASLVGTKHSEVKERVQRLTVALSVSTGLKKLKWTWRPKRLWSFCVFSCSLYYLTPVKISRVDDGVWTCLMIMQKHSCTITNIVFLILIIFYVTP